MSGRLVILTNLDRFPEEWKASNGATGGALVAKSVWAAIPLLRRADLVLINSNPRLTLQLAALFTAVPFLRRPIVAADAVFRKPEHLFHRLTLPLKRLILSHVDRFLHLFKDLSGYEKHFRIGRDRSDYVAFKPNLRYRCDVPPNPDGEYVLCFGQSMRDFDTFFDAVERLPYPAAIAKIDLTRLRRHGSKFTRRLDRLPRQVRLIEHDPESDPSRVKVLMGAKLVVVPLLKSCLVMAGTPLNAMLLGKCVIVTEGPATHGLYTDEVLPVPPEDPAALAALIERAWNDRELREKTAAAGYRLAMELGGEPEYVQRLIDLSVGWYCSRRSSVT